MSIQPPHVLPVRAVEFRVGAVVVLAVVRFGEFAAASVVFVDVVADVKLVLNVAQHVCGPVISYGHGGAEGEVPDTAARLDPGEQRADCAGSDFAGFAVDRAFELHACNV